MIPTDTPGIPTPPAGAAAPLDPPHLLAYASLAASMALVGSYVGLSKLLVLVFPVFLLAWLRFGIAAVAMAGWVRRRPGEAALTPHDRVLLFWESFLGNFLFSICMLYGVAMTSALAAGVTMAAHPGRRRAAVVDVPARAHRAARGRRHRLRGRRHRAGRDEQAGSRRRRPPRPAATPGSAICCWSARCVCEASYVVIGKRLTGNLSAKRISALVNLWGLALVTPLGLWQALSFDFGAVGAGTWALLLFYSLAASMVTVWLWMTGLKHVPASSAGVFTVMLPVSAAAVGVIFLGERINGGAGAGLRARRWPASCWRPGRRAHACGDQAS